MEEAAKDESLPRKVVFPLFNEAVKASTPSSPLADTEFNLADMEFKYRIAGSSSSSCTRDSIVLRWFESGRYKEVGGLASSGDDGYCK